MCSYDHLRLVGGLVICKMDLVLSYCWCLAGCWDRFDFFGWYLYRWDLVWFVLYCILLVSSFGLDYGVG